MAYIGKTFDQQLHLHSSKESFFQAKNLRVNQTESESILWNELKNRKCFGLKFRRQHPILSFVADFYCHEKRLIVEVDGSVHDNEEAKERDENRTYELERYGIKVIRFTNHEIKHNINEVLIKIKQASDSQATP
jgi:very-short-patch-repair endonuclease